MQMPSIAHALIHSNEKGKSGDNLEFTEGYAERCLSKTDDK